MSSTEYHRHQTHDRLIHLGTVDTHHNVLKWRGPWASGPGAPGWLRRVDGRSHLRLGGSPSLSKRIAVRGRPWTFRYPSDPVAVLLMGRSPTRAGMPGRNTRAKRGCRGGAFRPLPRRQDSRLFAVSCGPSQPCLSSSPSTQNDETARRSHATPALRRAGRIAHGKLRILVATHVSSPNSRRRCVIDVQRSLLGWLSRSGDAVGCVRRSGS